MLRLYSIQVSFGYIFSFARSDSFGHIYTTILLMLICSRKGHFRPELSTHPDNAGYTQDLDQILISNSPATYFLKCIRDVQEDAGDSTFNQNLRQLTVFLFIAII